MIVCNVEQRVAFRSATSTVPAKVCAADDDGKFRLAAEAHVEQLAPLLKAKKAPMLHWACWFFVVALLAGFFGFGSVSAMAAVVIAQILFIVFLGVSAFTFAVYWVMERGPPPIP